MYNEVFKNVRIECEKNPRLLNNITVLSADTSISVKTIQVAEVLGIFGPDAYQGRMLRLPLAENLLLGIAEGLSHEHLFPIVGIYESLIRIVMEELESICRSLSPTKGIVIVATHSGYSCPDGRGIQSITLPSILSKLPNLNYIEPTSLKDAAIITKELLQRRKGIYVLRCPRKEFCLEQLPPRILELGFWDDESIRGKNEEIDADVVIVCNGSLAKEATRVIDIVHRWGIQVRILLLRCLSLANKESAWLRELLERANLIITIHDSFGGYLRNVIEKHLMFSCNVNVCHFEAQGFGQSGTYNELLNVNGLDAQSIVKCIRKHFRL
ncbi:transketolase C-terminal domain-containing protein [Planctomycetota bacterium]